MGQLLKFQDFEDDADPVAPPEPALESLPGYAEGYRAAQAEADIDRAASLTSIAQTLEVLAFSFAEAHQHMMAQLRPLFTALTHHILPGAISESFRLHIVDMMIDVAVADTCEIAEIRLAPETLPSISELVENLGRPILRLVPDSTLEPHQAEIRFGDVETTLNTGALFRQISEVLAAFIEVTEETAKHG